jgi:hypothetical protein
MVDYAGKYTVKDATKLHKGDPQPHDINGTGPSPDFGDPAGGMTAKIKDVTGQFVVKGKSPRGVNWK